jgi:ribosome-binding factor A
MDAARARKLSDRIARIVAEMLERRVKDPRLGFVTVTAAKLTNDLREATVFYTVYGSAEERAETAAALASATGLIRSEVGHQTGLRHTPSLAFVADTVPEGARRMEDLVAQARAADARLATAREGAVWAGDADPYRPAPGSAEDGQPAAAEDGQRGAAGDGQPGAAEAGAAEPGAAEPGAAGNGQPEPATPGGQRGSGGGDRVGGSGGGDLLSGTPGGGDHGAGYSPA